ncbi:MAG: conjugal transfer protein TraI [Bacteroidota bacterium]|nr:conjugal transfer protein TraI [Bacteroidota bacterium]
MKRIVKIGICVLGCLFLSLAGNRASAQIPGVGIVSGVIKKIITALDLKVQQLQNQTIALQNAEASVENNLHLSSLNNISGWLNKERTLYQNYYQELAKVRILISDYDEVKKIISQQQELLSEYQSASVLFHQDKHFSGSELSAMENVYGGILQESIRDLEEVTTAVEAFSTQMDDAERLLRISHASAGMQTNLDHLRQYNNQNAIISYERANSEQERQTIKQLYGIQ